MDGPDTHDKKHQAAGTGPGAETAFGCARDFLANRFVYAVVSPRARGLSLGVNMNPDKLCNMDCVYCEVNRRLTSVEPRLDVDRMAAELIQTLAQVHTGQLALRPGYSSFPTDLLTLKHVALSGDGEPTLCPIFGEALQAVIHIRAQRKFPFFKIVLITNGTGLDLPQVQESLGFLTRQDEIWVKLDAGTPADFQIVNRPAQGVVLQKILDNVLMEGRKREIVIQSLFPVLNGREPSHDSILAYAARLKELKNAGAQIALVQIYSATRPVTNPECGHMPLKSLSQIAHFVRQETGLNVEVY